MGQPCGLFADGVTPEAYYCQEGSVCHHGDSAQSGTCLPPPAQGEPCAFSPNFPDDKTCGSGLHCDESVTPALCALPPKTGEACTYLSECGPGSLCACPPATTECAVRTCQIVRFAGERCDEPNSMCHPAFSCEAGVCKPIALRGLFAQSCPGP
jgi:hypothetical protein